MSPDVLILAIGENSQPWGAISVYHYLADRGYNAGFLHLYGGLADLDQVTHAPKFVGLSTYTPTAAQTMRTACEIRRRWPTAKIVIGGRHICQDIIERDGPEWLDVADYLVTGDGEYAMVEIIKGTVPPGVIRGTWFSGEDLAGLSLPDKDFARVNFPYPRRDELLFSRGCPYRCTFCGCDRPKIIHVEPVRAARYLADWAAWHRRFPIFIMDDVFTADRRWLLQFADAYERYASHVPIRCFVHGRQFNAKLASTLKRFRLTQVSLGAESGSDRILSEINKGTTVQRYREIGAICHDAGITLHCLWMLGHPGETPETLQQTVDAAREIGDDRGHASHAIPFPGTAFWKQAQTAGEILDWDYSHWDNRHVIFKPHGVTVKQLVNAKREIGG